MTERIIVGSKVMARIISCSERTIRRAIASNRLPAWKMNGGTSPWRARRSDLERLRVQGCEE